MDTKKIALLFVFFPKAAVAKGNRNRYNNIVRVTIVSEAIGRAAKHPNAMEQTAHEYQMPPFLTFFIQKCRFCLVDTAG